MPHFFSNTLMKKKYRHIVNMVKITYKGETRDIPKRYIPDTLTKAERLKQIKSIFEEEDRPKTKVRSRKSSATVEFNKMYGERLKKMKGGKSVENIAKVVGLPFRALKEVFLKGEGAYYSAGSRPNQTAQSWAYGRLYSFITGIGGARKADKDIIEKYGVEFK
tara:strand:+ start:12374 stop:12862 length:489 start_codon:yes stop_codon:yes gene_type:complete